MTRIACIDPIILKEGEVFDVPSLFALSNERIEYYNQVKLYSIDFEITQKCGGSCACCYTGSTLETDTIIPKEKVLETIDEAKELGIKLADWSGGDPVLHPDWFEIVSYAAEKGMRNCLLSSGLISKKVAKQLCELQPTLDLLTIDISTINPEAYRKVHTDPSTLEMKIQGYRTLLEAGYPPGEISGIMACTQPALETIEETFDWFLDEMGAKTICLVQFKPDYFGDKYRHLEPSLGEVKKALEYRARRLGSDWLKVGSMDANKVTCRTTFGIKYDGRVTPCANVPFAVGNIYEESLTDIVNKHIDTLTYNSKIKGFCGSGKCEYSDVCFGCRGTAYFCGEGGDFLASDDKCYLNPDAPEYSFRR